MYKLIGGDDLAGGRGKYRSLGQTLAP